MNSEHKCMPERLSDEEILKSIQSSAEASGAFTATREWGYEMLKASVSSRGDTFDRTGAVVLEMGEESLRIPVAEMPATIGSGQKADFRLEGEGISRLHCHLECIGSLVRVVDDHSTNGVVLNRKKVSAEDLCDGDELVLGSTVLRIRKV